MTGHTFSATVPGDFPDISSRVRAALADEGFGILTEIDVAATMKRKLGVDMPAQVILGACNPPLAHRALAIEPSIGVLLPCNVVVRAVDHEHTAVEAMDPEVMVRVTGNDGLACVAADAGSRLVAAIGKLCGEPKGA